MLWGNVFDLQQNKKAVGAIILAAWKIQIVVSVDLISAQISLFRTVVYYEGLKLSICDIIVSQKLYNGAFLCTICTPYLRKKTFLGKYIFCVVVEGLNCLSMLGINNCTAFFLCVCVCVCVCCKFLRKSREPLLSDKPHLPEFDLFQKNQN